MLVVLAAVLLCSTEVNSRVCDGGSKVLTDSNGRLNSPDSGQSGTCTWKLDVPKDLRIIFYFESYEIDYCGDYATCSGCSRIELKDDPNEPPWKLFCGRKSEIPEPISANKSVLFVNFVLANGDSKSWFTAEYITWPFEGKIDLLTNSSAEISSPNFPGKYPRNSYFQWSAVAPSGYRIKVVFTKFDILYCDDCNCDFLMVRDGSKESNLLGKFCYNPKTLYTSGNLLWMEFLSALNHNFGNSDSIGFKATVSRELKLYVIVVPCVLGILFVSIIAVAAVVMCRRRRFSSTRNGAPVVQMSLLNEDESVSNTQMTDIGPHSEASLPVYRPTTQAIKR
ncbi:hypothetical protein OS493_019465 [Desmophyllum pertusum]|uniref:CUB domain-containing protein n=1 Tax=Desmophyllum pertusum TaxID=174260 RepID=A0A9X0D8K9_9CNID|nr:hypothetical protein OS493_019465 [Desmophyllum pertusum]